MHDRGSAGSSFLQGGGEMGALMRALDWSATPLGPPETWPQALKITVRLVLTTDLPMCIWWGPELIPFYNDAHRQTMAPEHHPGALGGPGGESWDVIGPLIEQVMATGQATGHEAQRVTTTREGQRRDIRRNYSFSPIDDESAPNGVGGVLAIGREISSDVVVPPAGEERYRTLIESIDEGFCILQLIFDGNEKPIDYRYVETNSVFEQQTGMRDALGKTVRELVPDIEPFWFDIYGRVALTGEPTRFVEHARSMGRWFDVYAVRIGEPQERQVAVLFSDITERKRVEAAQLRSEERLKSAFAIKTVGVMFWGDGFGLTDMNDAFLHLTGFSREEALGKTWQELTPEEFHAASWRAVEEVTTVGETTPYEKQYFRKDGSRWWGLFAARKVGGEVVEFVLDVTGRKQVEAALRESEARFRHMADSAPALIWMTDAEGQLSFANMHYDHLFGRPATEMTGSGWRNVIHPDDLPAFERAFGEAFSARLPFRTEVRVRNRHGAICWLRCEGVPRLDDAHRFLGYTGCNVDITDVKVAEERRSLLINELNHRVKNTLATVQSIASQSLRNAATAAEARHALELRLLALSRAHDVLTRENWEGAWIQEVVAEVMSPFIGEEETRFHCEGPEIRLSPRAALALAMAFQELATNAVKYGALSNETGEIHLSWRVRRTGDAARLLLGWEERGGPIVAPPKRRGFGSRLIERSLAQDLGGEVTIDFRPGGVVCTIDAPLPADVSLAA